MWVIYAFGSALFAGCMSVLAKVGIKDVDSNLATALRTVIVAVFAWLMVFVVGSQAGIVLIDGKSFIFLILSGFATGASWLCYFRALQIGDVNKVTPVDKSSTVLTMLLSFIFLGEGLGPAKAGAMLLIGVGTYMMIERKKQDCGERGNEEEAETETGKDEGNKEGRNKGEARKVDNSAWLLYALLSALFASLTSILAKIGIEEVESNLGTAIRTVVVLIMAWGIVLLQRKQKGIKAISRRSWVFIGISGLATGLSWLCFYRALREGPASVVVPVDKLSILVTVGFGYFILKEKMNRRSFAGLVMIVAGTAGLLFV